MHQYPNSAKGAALVLGERDPCAGRRSLWELVAPSGEVADCSSQVSKCFSELTVFMLCHCRNRVVDSIEGLREGLKLTFLTSASFRLYRSSTDWSIDAHTTEIKHTSARVKLHSLIYSIILMILFAFISTGWK